MADNASGEQGFVETARLFLDGGGITEVRILNPDGRGKRIAAGYFDDPLKIAQAISVYDGSAAGIYITLNPVRPALLSRYANRIAANADLTTSDQDVVRRTRILLDFDPLRPSGISSTDPEHLAALATMERCRDYLTSRGWPAPIEADSGNGGHLLYGIDLPNDAESTRLIERVLTALAMQFDTNAVHLDTGVANAARITKLYGTLVRKGDSTPERPHRRSAVLHTPSNFKPVPKPLLESLASRAHDTSGNQPSYTRDISRALQERGITYEASDWRGGTLYQLDECPFNSEHRDTARVVQLPGGALHFGCFHDSCEGKDWAAFKEKIGLTFFEKSERPARTFRLLTDSDLDVLEPPHYLIDKILAAGAFGGLVGAHASYKSFLALDWALSIATGTEWAGHPVQKGCAVYISGEGYQGMRARIRAWKQVHGFAHIPNFRLLGEAVNFLHDSDGTAFMDAITALPVKPSLVVVDTLARAMVGGEENSAKDMGMVIAAANQIQQATGASVLVLHHVNKSMGEIRGSTALPGALDTLYEVKRDHSSVTITCQKMKDGEEPEAMVLEAEKITIADGITSLILKPSTSAGSLLNQTEHRVLKLLVQSFGAEAASQADLKAIAEEKGIKRSAYFEAKKSLVTFGYITQSGTERSPRLTITDAGVRAIGQSGNSPDATGRNFALESTEISRDRGIQSGTGGGLKNAAIVTEIGTSGNSPATVHGRYRRHAE